MTGVMHHIVRLSAVLCLALFCMGFTAGTPITTDSRIKTFVYNENDVYRLTTHYGYQLNIEFGKKERIQTISVGDRAGWQIVPSGQRLFVRAMQDKAHTNMTVVTNKRAYQFDLYSAQPNNKGWDELVYVVRFYYPDDQKPAGAPNQSFSPNGMSSAQPMQFPTSTPSMPPPMMGPAPVNSGFMPPMPRAMNGGMPYQGSMNAMPMTAPQPFPGQPYVPPPQSYNMPGANQMMTPPPAAPNTGGMAVLAPSRYGNTMRRSPLAPVSYGDMAPAAGGGADGMQELMPLDAPLSYNYNYSFTGEQSLLPSQMFDDGQHTFLLFPEDKAKPELFVVTADGKERQIPLSRNNEYVTAPGVYARMTLRKGGLYACIYNEMKAKL